MKVSYDRIGNWRIRENGQKRGLFDKVNEIKQGIKTILPELEGDKLIAMLSKIELSISRYPVENISRGIDNVYELEGYITEKLPNPNIGEGSIAIRYTDDVFSLRIYRIQFYKKDIFITLDNGGVTTDYELLKELAKKVEKKI